MQETSTGHRLKSPFGQWLTRTAALLLIAVQAPVLLGDAWDPNQSDFGNYFAPAFALANDGDLGKLYDRDEFARWLDRAGLSGLGSFVPHPPANALWLRPLASLPPPVAKACWTIILLASAVVTVVVLPRIAPLSQALAIVIVLAPTLAIRNSLAFGQPYLILAAWLACGVWALHVGRGFLGGVLLGLGVSFKPYALGILFLFLHRNRLRSLAGFACGVLAPFVALLLLARGHPSADFFEKVGPWMLRGDIQDPFAAGWGSLSALVNRLLRFEPDLNPHPWLEAPLLARFLTASSTAALLTTSVLCGRRALRRDKPLEAVGILIAFALAASPFGASYHLVLLVVPVLAVAARLRGGGLAVWLFCWALLGSPLVNAFRSAAGSVAPLAYLRWFCILGLAIAASKPFLDRRVVPLTLAAATLAGVLSLPWGGNTEIWPRIEAARGYSMQNPYFCGEDLRWWSPAKDGRKLATQGAGTDCTPLAGTSPVSSRFLDGSWNLYFQTGDTNFRLTFSDANEVDPVLSPDACSVVFASDQDRGLGSTALYRLDLSSFNEGCAPGGHAAIPPPLRQ